LAVCTPHCKRENGLIDDLSESEARLREREREREKWGNPIWRGESQLRDRSLQR
jgi:hypothetical protein